MRYPLTSTLRFIAAVWLLGATTLSTPTWAQAAILVRNRIPGIVDAPAYDVDGTTRLDNDVIKAKGTYYASAVYAGSESNQLLPVGSPLLLGCGEQAGYWDTASNDGVLFVPWVRSD